MADKILCGGFKIDGTSLVEENGILKATATGLPDASEATNGQGLIVEDGEFVIGDLPHGGGSSLPDSSITDIGKVLTVAEDQEHTSAQYVCTEQTVTTNADYGNAVLDGFNYDTWELLSTYADDEKTGTITINGTAYLEQFYWKIIGDFNEPAIKHGNVEIVWRSDNERIVLYGDNDTTYTVSVAISVSSTTAVWESVPLPYYSFAKRTQTLPSGSYTIDANSEEIKTFDLSGQNPVFGETSLLDVKIWAGGSSPLIIVQTLSWTASGKDLSVKALVKNTGNTSSNYTIVLNCIYNEPSQCRATLE